MENKAKTARNSYMKEYMRKYRKTHPDKVKEIRERYWEKKYESFCKNPESTVIADGN